MDQPKIERMLRLMKLMSGNVDYSIDELASRLDMSWRTIYRYIDTFKAAGFAVARLPGGVFKLGKLPAKAPDFDRLIYFSEEEAYLVNSLLDRLDRGNALKANLKAKLAVIYQSTSIADFVDRRFMSANVEALSEAVKQKRKAVLKNYESGHSHTVRDRLVEPFGFTVDFADVWAYDLEDGRNKVFRISRVGEVEVLDDEWTSEAAHERQKMDIFRMSGSVGKRVRLLLSVLAKNLLVEEYPLAEKCLRPFQGELPSSVGLPSGWEDGREVWMLDTEVYDYAGVCRFCAGLGREVLVVGSPELSSYIGEFVRREFGNYFHSAE